jgi:hypothetical protein
MTDRPTGITVDHNTVIQGASGGIAKIEDVVDGFVFTNNLIGHGDYGIIATAHGVGNDTIHETLPGSRIVANVIAGGNANAYPPGNFFPSMSEFHAQFLNFGGRDFRLASSSKWLRAGTDGKALGADLSAMPEPAK